MLVSLQGDSEMRRFFIGLDLPPDAAAPSPIPARNAAEDKDEIPEEIPAPKGTAAERAFIASPSTGGS